MNKRGFQVLTIIIGIIIFLILSFIILFLGSIYEIFIFISADRSTEVTSFKVTVLDSVTNKPISGIEIERMLVVRKFKRGSECSCDIFCGMINICTKPDKERSIIEVSHTDGGGNSYFEARELNINSLKYFNGGEELLFNSRNNFNPETIITYDHHEPENENYHPIYWIKNLIDYDSIIESNGMYTVKLSPIVDSVEECQGSQLCIQDNSLDLAFKNNDFSLCFNIKDKYKRNSCFENLAIINKDKSICDNIQRENPKHTNMFIDICYGYVDNPQPNECDVMVSWSNRTKNLCQELYLNK